MFYVRLKSVINGRNELREYSIRMATHSLIDVEYHPGGWDDMCVNNVWPHLRFQHEEDAIAYCLAVGNTYSTKIPEQSVVI